MSLSDFLFGSKNQMNQLPTMSPEQMQMFNQLIGGLSGQQGNAFGALQDMLMGGPGAQGEVAQRQFNEQTVPNLAERFTAQGGRQSSAFTQALGGAGAGLSERLAAMGQERQSQGLGYFNQMMGQGLGKDPFAYHETQGQPGLAHYLMGGLGTVGGAFAGGLGGGMAKKWLGV